MGNYPQTQCKVNFIWKDKNTLCFQEKAGPSVLCSEAFLRREIHP